MKKKMANVEGHIKEVEGAHSELFFLLYFEIGCFWPRMALNAPSSYG
jgi:hypothetical protein